MTRSWFGGTTQDIVVAAAADGSLHPTTAVLTFWNAQTGGSQWTDLLLGGVGATAIAVDATGLPPRFQGPDQVTEMWADTGVGAGRVLLQAHPNIVIVAAGTTGYASQPDNTLWIEYA